MNLQFLFDLCLFLIASALPLGSLERALNELAGR